MSDGCQHGGGHGPAVVGRATAALRRSARKVTTPRTRILEILAAHPHPRTIREIRAELGKVGCDLATIYRAMHLLIEMGMVQRFDFGDGAARFELVRHGISSHHHHVICTRCAGVVELDECAMKRVDRWVAAKTGFVGVAHRLEFFGVCPSCQLAG